MADRVRNGVAPVYRAASAIALRATVEACRMAACPPKPSATEGVDLSPGCESVDAAASTCSGQAPPDEMIIHCARKTTPHVQIDPRRSEFESQEPIHPISSPNCSALRAGSHLQSTIPDVHRDPDLHRDFAKLSFLKRGPHLRSAIFVG